MCGRSRGTVRRTVGLLQEGRVSGEGGLCCWHLCAMYIPGLHPRRLHPQHPITRTNTAFGESRHTLHTRWFWERELRDKWASHSIAYTVVYKNISCATLAYSERDRETETHTERWRDGHQTTPTTTHPAYDSRRVGHLRSAGSAAAPVNAGSRSLLRPHLQPRIGFVLDNAVGDVPRQGIGILRPT